MTENKHTPGPWDWNRTHCEVTHESLLIATLFYDPDLITDEQINADARLIAAAPDLLAALRWAVAKFNCEPYEWVDRDDVNAHKAAIAAIAKARGK